MNRHCVSVIQMVSGEDWEDNVRTGLRLMAQAVEQGAQLIVLPENWAVFTEQGYVEFGKDAALSEQVFATVQSFCRDNNVWVAAGSIPTPPQPLHEAGKHYTRLALIDHRGHCVVHYDKIHLFDVDIADARGSYRESDHGIAGHHCSLAETPFGPVGLAVCYDLRFPEMFRLLAQQGAQLFLVPSAFTELTGRAHWSVLVRARAIENLAFVLAANQGGIHSAKRHTYGHSCIVNPWGEIVQQASTGEAVLTAQIDRDQVMEHRQKMPVLDSCRFSIGLPEGGKLIRGKG